MYIRHLLTLVVVIFFDSARLWRNARDFVYYKVIIISGSRCRVDYSMFFDCCLLIFHSHSISNGSIIIYCHGSTHISDSYRKLWDEQWRSLVLVPSLILMRVRMTIRGNYSISSLLSSRNRLSIHKGNYRNALNYIRLF